MKKTLCWLLVVAMLVAMAPAVFAADEASNVLVEGSNAVELPGSVTSVEYTYTAESAGTLTVEFTDVGYVSTYSGSYSSQNPDERFNGTGGMAIWFEAYLNGEKLSEGYKGSIALTAGETATLEWRYVTTTFAANVKQGTVNVSFGAGGDAEQPGEDAETQSINVETTDNNCWIDKYTFTAEAAGVYTFEVPAGLGVWDAVKYDTDYASNPYVDYMANENGESFEVELAAGAEFSFYVAAATKETWTINYSFVAGEVEQPGEGGGEVEQPTASLVLGTNNASAADVLYSFTAESAGILTIDASSGRMQYGDIVGSVYTYGNLILEVNGVAVDSLAQGVYEMEVAADEVVTIKVTVANQMYVGSTINFVLSIAEPAAPSVELGNTTIDADVLYQYTAEADGKLTIDATSGTMQYGNFNSSVYPNGALILEVDGAAIDASARGLYEMDVTAGQVVSIQVKSNNAMYVGAKINLVLSQAEPVVPGPGEDDGEQPSSNVVGLGQTVIDAKTEYTFTAEADGTLTIDISTGTFEFYGTNNFSGSYYNYGMVLMVNGTAIDSANKGVYEMAVTAGQTVTIMLDCTNANYANVKGNLKLSLEEGIVEPPVDDNGSGTESDPFIIDELPATLSGTLSMDGDFYKFIATEDGVINAEFAGFLVTVKVNGENKNFPITVVAGDEIIINPWALSGNAAYELTVSYEEEEVDAPVVGSGSGTESDPFIIEVPYTVNDHSGDKYYQFTAPKDGKILVTFEAGACLISGSSVGSWESMPGGRYIEVAAGDVITINYWNGTSFNVAYEEAAAETIIEGETITLNTSNSGISYAWIAEADGEFIVEILSNSFTFGYTLTVNGQSMGYGTNEAIFQVQAGDKIVVEFVTNNAAADTWALTLSGALSDGSCRHEYDENGICTKCGAEHEADGSADYPFVIDQIPGTYSFETLPLFYKFVASEKVTLIIRVDKSKNHMLARVTGALSNTNVVEGNLRVYTIEVDAGATLSFQVMTLGSDKTGEFTVEYKQECQHENTTERQENVVEATCQAGGSYDKIVRCDDCGKDISSEHILTEALEHTHAERNENVVDATCQAGGSYDKVTYCSVCDEVISTENIPTDALQHNYVDGVCSGCGAADPDYVAPGCEHNYVNGVCDKCGEQDPNYEDPNPGTGSMDILAIVLITMMSVVAIVTVSTKKAYKA